MERGGRGILVAPHDVPRREIVGDRVAGDVRERLLDRHVSRDLADHGGELDLPVDHLRVDRQLDPGAGPHHRAPRSLDEVPGLFSQLFHCRPGWLALGPRHLGHVIGVVRAGAVDVARVQHRCQQPRTFERHALCAPLARRDVLGTLSQEPAGSAPVLEHTEHARMGGGVCQLCRIVHGVAHKHARARSPIRLVAQ